MLCLSFYSIPISAEISPDFNFQIIQANYTPLVPITINYNANAVIRSEANYIGFDLMTKVSLQLERSGYASNPYDYRIRSVIISAKSFDSNGAVRLCSYPQSLASNARCRIVNQTNLIGEPIDFNNQTLWNSYGLLVENSSHAIDFPIDIQFKGRIRLNSVTVILEPIFPVQQLYPAPLQPNDFLLNPLFPDFLFGVNIYENLGASVLIGKQARLEKSLLRQSSRVTFANINFVFQNFSWVNVTSLQNASIVESIVVNCLDARGVDVSFKARNLRGDLIKNLYINPGTTITFPVAYDCKYIQSIMLSGYSPEAVGHRARIEIILN